MKRVDVAVVGAGAAGLQTALTLGRACRTVALIDGDPPRNAAARRVTNFLAIDDASPRTLIDRGLAILRPYAVETIGGGVESARGSRHKGFTLLTQDEKIQCRAVVLAHGVEALLH